MKLLLEVLLLVSASYQQSQSKPCRLRDLGDQNKICVCDSDYCDTIPRPEKVSGGQYLWYTSNRDGLRFNKTTGSFGDVSSSRCTINIDRQSRFQTVLGWGGAFTDSTGINIKSLQNEATQRLLLESYFSENGIEYNLCRVPIAGTDFSTRAYSYDDAEEPDPELQHFALAPEDYNYKIPFIKMAQKLRNNTIKLFGSTWAAPKWMKTNNRYDGYGFIKNDSYQVWADYFVRFLEEYQKNGINFWGLTTQNEPLLAILELKGVPSVGWTSVALGDWVGQNLGPTIKNSNFPDTKIMILDDQKVLIPWYTNSVLEGKNVKEYVSGIAIHWYLGDVTPCSAMTKTHKDHPNMFILSTEACSGFQGSTGVFLGSWERGENYTVDIIEDLSCYVVGWVDWNMVLDLEGGPTYVDNTVDAPIVVNASSGEFYKQPMFYHMAHHSKFVPEGSVRIGSSLINNPDDKDLMAVAYQRPDGGIAVVILNRRDEDVAVNINDQSQGTISLNVTKRSVNTLLYW